MNLRLSRARLLLLVAVACAMWQPSDGESQASFLQTANVVNEPSLLSRTVTLEMDGVRLGDALAVISRQADFGLIYGNSVVPVERRVTVRLQSTTVAEALRAVLRDTGVQFSVGRAGQIVLVRDGDVRTNDIRVGTITGRVTDTATGQPIAAASVIVVGTGRGAQTDPTGRYTITAVPAGAHRLQATVVGYGMQEQSVTVADGQSATANFQLATTAVALEGLVVIGYGDARRQDVTGSVATVGREAIVGLPTTSADQALMGRVPGMSVTTPSGIPGGAPNIQLRGASAVGAGNQPLYVVDGYALPQLSDAQEIRFRNPLADIPAEDIESITVLKDASASAIYGSRGSNGVILITTRSGRAGTPQISVNAYTALQSDVDWMIPEAVNARELAEFENYIWQARVNAGQAREVPKIWQNPEQYGEGTDWFRIVRRDAWMHNAQVSVSGGSEAVRSYFSLGGQRQQGVVHGSDFSRISLRANIDAELGQGLNAGVRLAPSFTRRNQPGVSGETRSEAHGLGFMTCPIPSAYNEDGTLNPFIVCEGMFSQPNALHLVKNVTDVTDNERALASAFVDWEIFRDVSLRSTVNVDWSNRENTEFTPSTVANCPPSPTACQISRLRAPPNIPQGSVSTNRYLNWLSETTVSVSADAGPGFFTGVAGFSATRERSMSSSFSAIFPDDEIRTLNAGQNLTGTSDEQNWSLLSYLARASYNLFDRYVVTATLRADGSSRFGENNRWGLFPSAAVAWHLHGEGFMEGLGEVIPELTVRASAGLTGNNQIGNYPSLGTVVRDDYLFGSTVAGGRRLSTMANEELGWERTAEYNLGLNAQIGTRVNLQADTYYRRTTDLLLSRALPRTSGFASVPENTGTVRNLGVDVGLSTTNVSRDDFSWLTNVTWSMYRNKVLALPGDEPITSGHNVTKVGYPIGMHHGLVFEGIYQTQEDIENYPSFQGAVPGNIRWRDVNGDGVIVRAPADEGGDFDIVGNPHPKFTFSVNNQITLGRFDTNIQAAGRVGGDINRRAYFQNLRNIDGIFVVSKDYFDNFWRSAEQPGDGRTPTPLGGPEARQQYRDSPHSLRIEDGSNFWIRNISVGYALPTRLLQSVSTARVYATIQNPLIVTGYAGNPDASSSVSATSNLQPGQDQALYPIARMFTIGLDLTF